MLFVVCCLLCVVCRVLCVVWGCLLCGVCCLLFVVFVVCCVLFVVGCLLSVVCCVLCVVCCLSCVVCCLLCVGCCVLLFAVACCLLCVVCCVLCVVCCLLFVVCVVFTDADVLCQNKSGTFWLDVVRARITITRGHHPRASVAPVARCKLQLFTMALIHTLPLDRSCVFEVALMNGEEMPAITEWTHLSLNKATDAIQCAILPPLIHYRREIFFNHATGFAMAARKYYFKCERGGAYIFKHCSGTHPDVVVRESKPRVISITVDGYKVVGRGSVSGEIMYEQEFQPNKPVRLMELRDMMKQSLINTGAATKTTQLKLLREGTDTILRGNTVILRGAARIRARPRRRTGGQSVITHFD